jgi:hypothetical protein
MLIVREWYPQSRPVQWLSSVGESSLLVFILQAYLYQLAPLLLGNRGLAFWFAYFAATLGAMAIAARWWARRKMNRYFTVGLPEFVGRLTSLDDASAVGLYPKHR